MDDSLSPADKMAGLQKLRVGVVILLSQETSKLLSRRQRLSGKEIERMCAERDLAADPDSSDVARVRDQVLVEEYEAKTLLEESEDEITRLEQLLSKIQTDILALHQA